MWSESPRARFHGREIRADRWGEPGAATGSKTLDGGGGCAGKGGPSASANRDRVTSQKELQCLSSRRVQAKCREIARGAKRTVELN